MVSQESKKRSASKLQVACCSRLAQALDARLFKALSEPTRLQILIGLTGCCGQTSVGEIARKCRVDLSVVSRHLAILREAGVLRLEKKGRSVFYEVRYAEISAALRRLADAIDACCPR